MFQSTRPRRARRIRAACGINQRSFQSTRPRRARREIRCQQDHVCIGFNPRAHAGRDPRKRWEICFIHLFQSTRPRRARRSARRRKNYTSPVSIHAPTQGATRETTNCWHWVSCFNPRAHAGRDKISTFLIKPYKVSIHAPTQGATRLHQRTSRIRSVSIHAPTQGATRNQGDLDKNKRSFNPRAHAGRDCLHLTNYKY